MSEGSKGFLVGLFLGAIGFGFLLTSFPEPTRIYKECELKMFKEAYAKGYAVKEINKDDKVIYKWK